MSSRADKLIEYIESNRAAIDNPPPTTTLMAIIVRAGAPIRLNFRTLGDKPMLCPKNDPPPPARGE